MRGVAVGITFAMAILALAGCLGNDDGGGAKPPPKVTVPQDREDPAANATAPPAAPLGETPAPRWNVGEYWAFSSAALHGETVVLTNFTAIVVAADDGYTVGASENQTTYLDALLIDLLPIGTVDANLQPTWRGAAFAMFQWPLADGVTWQADVPTGDGTAPLTFAVGSDAAIETPYGTRPGFRVSALDNGTLLYAYTYVPAAGWFTLFEEFDEDGTRVRWTTVTGWGSGWAEPAYTLAAESLLERSTAYESPEDPRSPFAVAKEYSYLFYWVHGKQRGIMADHRAVLFGPDNSIRDNHGWPYYRPLGDRCDRALGCTGIPNDWWHWRTMPAEQGTWTLVLENGGAGNLEARVLGITDVVHQL